MEWISLILLVILHVMNNRSSSVPTFGDTSSSSHAYLMEVFAVMVAVAVAIVATAVSLPRVL